MTKNSETPLVAIVTLNWNGLEHLRYFIPSALSQDYKNYFIIVVDNGSTDDSVEYVKNKYSNIKVIRLSENLGYSAGFNKGINLAVEKGAENILVTNNDVILHERLLSSGVALYSSEKNIGCMGGKVYNMGTEKKFQYAGGRLMVKGKFMRSRGESEIDKGQYEDVCDFDFMDDVCTLVNSKMVKEIGAYDPDFVFDFEETEWNFRMRNNNYRIVYNPQMLVWHKIHGSTGGKRFSTYSEFYHWRGKILFHFKTKSNNLLLYSFFNIFFLEFPLRCGLLIKRNHTSLIFQTFLGTLSGVKRCLNLV